MPETDANRICETHVPNASATSISDPLIHVHTNERTYVEGGSFQGSIFPVRYAHEPDRPLRRCGACGHLTKAHALFVGHCHVDGCDCQHVPGEVAE